MRTLTTVALVLVAWLATVRYLQVNAKPTGKTRKQRIEVPSLATKFSASAPNFTRLTALLIKKHKQRVLGATHNTSLAYLRVAENIELLQLFTPFPLLMYATDHALFRALATVRTQRNSEFLLNTNKSWRDMYDPSVNINVESCDMAFLRPTCVINTTYFPPVLCETSCPHACGGARSKVNVPVELTILQRKRSARSTYDTSDSVWKLAKRWPIPPNFNACQCSSLES